MATLTRLYPLLKQLGLNDQQSQEFIETLETGILDHVATKADLEKVKAELKTDIEKVRVDLEKVKAELKTDIEKVRVDLEKVKADLLRWVFGAWATLFLAILALFLKLP